MTTSTTPLTNSSPAVILPAVSIPAVSIPAVSIPAASVTVVIGAVGDPEGTRTITSIVALLIVLGIALVMIAVWLFRITRPDPELLAPLEVMGERKWRRADPVWQRRRLDQVRPPDAQPLEPSTAPPHFDEAFELGPAAIGFDDLHEPAAEQSTVAAPPPAAPIDPGLATESQPEPDLPEEPDRLASGMPGGTPGDRPRTHVRRRDPGAAATPPGIERPTPEDLPDRELDPQLLAAAMAELDAELGHRAERDQSAE